MSDQLSELVEKMSEAHKENLKAVVLYGSAIVGDSIDSDRPKHVLVVLNRITPDELKAAHSIAEQWRHQGNPLPIYFTSAEIADSSDVFPIEFIDMSRVRRVLYGQDPFERLEIPTHNLRHQLEYELRGKLIRLRTLYIPASTNPDRLARLMADSLDSFAVLFRHALGVLGVEAPFEKRDAIAKLVEVLNLDRRVFARVFEYESDDQIWLETETNETFAAYLSQIEQVIAAIDHLPVEK